MREEVQESQGPRVQRSRGPKVPGPQGPRYLKLTFKYELDSKEGPSCHFYFFVMVIKLNELQILGPFHSSLRQKSMLLLKSGQT